MSELFKFAAQFQGEVEDRIATDGTLPFHETAFTRHVLEHLMELGATDGAEAVDHEGKSARRNIRISGYSVNETDERIDLFTSVYSGIGTADKLAKEQVDRAVARLAAWFVAVTDDGLLDRLEVSSDAWAMSKAVGEAAQRFNAVKLFVLTDGVSSVKEHEPIQYARGQITVEIWDIERIFRSRQSELVREAIFIDFEERFGMALPCVEMPEPADHYSAYLTIIPGQVIADLYDEHGARLLEYNVRSFLQAKGKVNKGIRKTLLEEPDRFLAYNNGISATVDNLELTQLPDGQRGIRSMLGLQIVNGGQTTASIHRASAQDRLDLSKVQVGAKITMVKQADKLEELVERISQYANTQNVIQIADFSANDSFHIELEKQSRAVWCPGQRGKWFYERARGQYQVQKARLSKTAAGKRVFEEQTPPARMFTKTDMARYLNAWNQKPQEVSKGAQKNFVAFTNDRARSGAWPAPDEDYYKGVVATAILVRAAERVVRDAGIQAYKPNIVAYLVAYLSFRSAGNFNLRRIWDEQTISMGLQRLLLRWSYPINEAILEAAEGRNVGEWCKKEACWHVIRQLDLPVPEVLPAEMKKSFAAGGARSSTLGADDYQLIHKCKQVGADEWLRLAQWGLDTEMLDAEQCKLAASLASMAALGWQKEPTRKQAEKAAQILQAAV
jgi:hypothetical protein